jgi:hypothetical protein
MSSWWGDWLRERHSEKNERSSGSWDNGCGHNWYASCWMEWDVGMRIAEGRLTELALKWSLPLLWATERHLQCRG